MTAPNENVTSGLLTLGQRLAEGPLPLSEALRYAMLLAEDLRPIHNAGRSCGVLLPSSIAITTTGLELISTPCLSAIITPYTAPEILQGHPPDCRSDIFAFGTIVYEMVTGRAAFAGDNADALAASLTNSDPQPSGTPAVDHLVGNCTAKDPNVRYQRMQKVVLELKLLTFAVSRAETVAHQQSVTAALRAETQQLEARLAALQQAHGTALIEMQRASSDVISELCARLSSVESELAAERERSALLEDLCQRTMTTVEQVQQNTAAIDERVASVKDGIDVVSQGATEVQEYVVARIREFEQTLVSQRTAIASLVAGQGHTDDVVEGVVEAMELLHTIVADREEDLN